jgi:hypothetical protein
MHIKRINFQPNGVTVKLVVIDDTRYVIQITDKYDHVLKENQYFDPVKAKNIYEQNTIY